MNKNIWLMPTLAIALFVGRPTKAQAPSGDASTYVNENQTDAAPLKMRGVEGRVLGLGGDAMPGASVSLFTENGHTFITSALTDKDGKFHFDKVEKGTYRVVVRVQGLCPANVPIQVESSMLAHHKLVVTMRVKDIDTCSYGMAK